MLAKLLRRCLGVGLLAGLLVQPAAAQPGDPPASDSRIAFVAGNARYEQGSVANALNDAGLVAEALRSIGFEIVEGADLTQADFLRSYRDFLDKVTESGEDAVAFVYFSGLGFEFEGDNYLVLADARIQRPSDLTLGTVRLADLIRPLAATPARAKIMAIDATRPLPFSIQGRRMARGLGAVEAEPTMLIGYSAAPGTVAEDRPGDYGPYATAIAEMIRAPNLDINAVFTQIRVRTHQATEGKQTPFHVTAIQEDIVLVPPEAPSDTGRPPQEPRIAGDDKPLSEVGPNDAYARAIERDTLEGYEEFAKAYPDSPYIKRIRATTRSRREAMLWLWAQEANTPEAYWTYLRRYPNGMYAADAEYRLRRLQAAFEPPVGFIPAAVDDVPLPPPEEPIDLLDFLPEAPPPPEDMIEPPAPLFAALPVAAVPVDVGGVLRGPGRIPRLREPRPRREGRDRDRRPGADRDRRPPRPPIVDRWPRQPRPGADRDRRPRPPAADRRQARPDAGRDRGRRQPGADRGRRQPGVDRGRRQPGADPGRRRAAVDRGRRQPGADRGRRQPGVDRGRRQPGVDRGRRQPGVDRRQMRQQRMQQRAQPRRQQRMQQRAQPQRQQRMQQRAQPRFQQRQQRMQQRAQPRMQQRAQPRFQQQRAQPRFQQQRAQPRFQQQPRMQQPRMQAPRMQQQRAQPRPQQQRRR